MRTWQQQVTAFATYVGGLLGNVEHLATDDKTSIVAAINELAAGGPGGAGFPPVFDDTGETTYNTGDLVIFEGQVWKCTEDGTVGSPADFPSRWGYGPYVGGLPVVNPSARGTLTVEPEAGSDNDGHHRYTVRDEDTWDEFATDSDVTATADGGTRARGTLAEPAAVELGDILRYVWWREAHDGTDYSVASVAYLQVDGPVSEGAVPTAFVVEVADADGVLQERLRIPSDGSAFGTVYSETAPADPFLGMRWIDTSDGETAFFEYVWWGDPGAWVQLGVFPTAIDDDAPDDDTEHTWSAAQIAAFVATYVAEHGGGGGGGGSGSPALVASGSFSDVSEFSLPAGAFDSTYDDYRLMFVPETYSAGTNCSTTFRFRAAGVDEDGAVYAWARSYGGAGGGAGGAAGGSGADGDTKVVVGDTHTPLHRGVIDILGPALAERTSLTAAMAMDEVGGGFFIQSTAAIMAVTTAYDSATIACSVGTMSGRWALYGYPLVSDAGGGATRSRLWTPDGDTNLAESDEFRGTEIDSAWSRVDAPGEDGHVSITQGGDCLSFKTSLGNDGAGPKLHALMRPYALAVGEYVQCHIRSAGIVTNYPAVALVVADGDAYGAGEQHVAIYISAGGFYGISHAAWTGYSVRSAGFVDSTMDGRINEFHMRLHRDTGDVWRLSISPDGVEWAEVSTYTHALTPTHVGLACTGWGSSTPFVFSCDYFRVGSLT